MSFYSSPPLLQFCRLHSPLYFFLSPLSSSSRPPIMLPDPMYSKDIGRKVRIKALKTYICFAMLLLCVDSTSFPLSFLPPPLLFLQQVLLNSINSLKYPLICLYCLPVLYFFNSLSSPSSSSHFHSRWYLTI